MLSEDLSHPYYSMTSFTFSDFKVYSGIGQIIACGFCWYKNLQKRLHWIAIYINLIVAKNRETFYIVLNKKIVGNMLERI